MIIAKRITCQDSSHCGTDINAGVDICSSGGVMIYFDRIEVVNVLRAEHGE